MFVKYFHLCSEIFSGFCLIEKIVPDAKIWDSFNVLKIYDNGNLHHNGNLHQLNIKSLILCQIIFYIIEEYSKYFKFQN